MTWWAFSANVKSELVLVDEHQNPQKKVESFENSLLSFSDVSHGWDFIFQQGNATTHTARVDKTLFQNNDITVLNRTAKSADLNSIENLSGTLTRTVYTQGRQFETKKSFICCIKECWSEISLININNLVYSIQTRCTRFFKQRVRLAISGSLKIYATGFFFVVRL